MYPLIAALGFVLFVIPSVGDNYWKAFFLPVIVLGFGMAVTVAPLTTDVMNSVDQDRVGTASGINNAVARVAGVLAVAVFGIVMIYGFRGRFDRSLASFSLPSGIVEQIHAQESRLAGLQIPGGVDPKTVASLKDLIGHAFVFGFRIVMVICAGLSVGSAAVGWLMIPNAGEHEAVN